MYTIRFCDQTRQNTKDSERNSIILCEDQINSLPILSLETFTDKTKLNGPCQFITGTFYEKVRNPKAHFPAIWIRNDAWQLEDSDFYLDKHIRWVLICLDSKKDIWIAFEYYDIATADDVYGSSVNVSFPRHGEIYRLNDACKDFAKSMI